MLLLCLSTKSRAGLIALHSDFIINLGNGNKSG